MSTASLTFALWHCRSTGTVSGPEPAVALGASRVVLVSDWRSHCKQASSCRPVSAHPNTPGVVGFTAQCVLNLLLFACSSLSGSGMAPGT